MSYIRLMLSDIDILLTPSMQYWLPYALMDFMLIKTASTHPFFVCYR